MKKLAEKVLCLLLAAVLLIPSNVVPAFAAGEDETVTIRPNVRDSGINSFSYTAYAGKSWTAGESEAYIDLGSADTRAEQCYYEVSFAGNAVEVFANKSFNHGKVQFSVDGKQAQKVDLYNGSRTQPQSVYKVTGLSEGEHVLKAVTLNERSGNAVVNQVAYVQVTHAPYVVTDLELKQTELQMREGQTKKLAYTVVPSYASEADLVFESADTAIVSVSEDGILTAKAPGETTVTISGRSADFQKSVKVTVTEAQAGIGGTIGDTNLQYTQKRYEEVTAESTYFEELTAWKNDKAVSELVLYSLDCRLSNVAVTASELTSETGAVIDAKNVTATFIKSTQAYNKGSAGYGNKYGVVPAPTADNRSESSDILYQTEPIDIPYNSLQPVWVEFAVPGDAEAGTYTGTLTATADGISTPLTFQYQIQVQDAELPDAQSFRDTFDIELWQYPYSSAEYYDVEPFSEEHYEIMRSSMLKYKEIGGHAITASIVEDAWNGQTYSKNETHYPSMVKWTKESDGSFTYDYTDFDKWVSFNKSLGLGDKIVLYSIAPWHNSFTYWENGVLKYEQFTAGSTRYQTVWKAFLTDLVDHLMEKGWFEDAYIGIDERGFSNAAFDLIESVKNIHAESLKTAGAMDGFVEKKALALRVTDLNVGDTAAAAHPQDFANLLAEREAKGYRTTLYSCTGHLPGNFSLSMPCESYWSIVNAGKSGTAGFLRWAYDAWVENPLEDTTHCSFEPGDCFLIYPDLKDAENPVSKSSVRLEKMAEGVRDINKLMLMEQQVPSLAGEIQKLYNKVTVTVQSRTAYYSEAQAAQLAAEMDAFKEGLAELTDYYIEVRKGLNLQETSKQLDVGDTWQIVTNLISDYEDKTILYTSENPEIASVDKNGLVTANKRGSTVIKVENPAAGYSETVEIEVVHVLYLRSRIPMYSLDEKYLSTIDKDENNERGRRYLGQPDMVMLDDNETLVTAYPIGHGKGPLALQISYDAGETWTEKTDIPQSWAGSQETPTMYKLHLEDGTQRLLMITACPGWGTDSDGNKTGWNTSYSDDGGETWTEYKHWYTNHADGSENNAIVAMASLIQLKDEDGNDIQKWMGVYHDYDYINYKTYLTFDENGEEQWSEPEPYLEDYRSIESTYQMCEIGMFRSPDGSRIVGLARSQSHNNLSTMIYSDDEGETWSQPVEMQGSLAGERHKAVYDPVSGRLLITFREICYDQNGNNQFDGANDWLAGDWVAWVGTYEDLMAQKQGQYRILIDEDWANNAKSGDTGYAGIVVQPDGTFIMDSYGHWDKDFSMSWGGGVTTDLCYIRQAKFKLADTDKIAGIPDKVEIKQTIEEAEQITDASLYNQASWNAFQEALEAAKNAMKNGNQEQVDAANAALKEAIAGLTPKPDTQKLEQAIAQAEKITDSSKYTAESYQAFQEALAKAKAVLKDPSATQAQVEEALQALKAAEGKLVVNDVKPAAPVIKVTSAGYNRLKITWEKKAGASTYEVYRAQKLNGAYKRIAVVSAGKTDYTDKKVKTGQKYYYKVRICIVNGSKTEYSAFSAIKSGMPVPAKGKLSSVKALSGGKMKLKWKKVSGASGYEVYRSYKKNGKYKKAAVLTKGKKTTYTDSKLKKGRTVYYKVRAYRKVGKKKVYGPYSSIKSKKTKK